MTTQSQRNAKLAKALEDLYGEYKKSLLFHGWHHIYFVAKKSAEFADELNVDKEIVEAAALTHDLNYIIDVKTQGPEAGEELRSKYLREAGFWDKEISKINEIVLEEHTAYRHANISNEAKVLSDADSLFKVMPINPILFANKFITETKVDLKSWAERIIREQQPLLDQDIYFYTKKAKSKYLSWAKTDLELVQQFLDAIEDPVILEMISIARELEVI